MDFSRMQLTVDYVKQRQLDNGGFFFAREAGTPSVEDTFYSIKILKALGQDVPRKEQVVRYLKGAQRQDGSFSSVEVARYVIEGLGELSDSFVVERGFKNWLLSSSSHGFWLKSESEIALELFEAATSVIKMTGMLDDVDVDRLRRDLAAFESEEGGYGIKRATLSGTYYAVRSLWNLGFDVTGECHDFLSKCEIKGLGFSERPMTYPPVISDIYHGIWLARATGYGIASANSVRDFVLSFMNGNGGFRYFPEMGISNLENTYYAVESLKLLEVNDRMLQVDNLSTATWR
ncbi:MAG: prenyltransferase/squalene oxidase repeat-containing protein [TACK group archaeon]|nr:prenyltransferase/squalene oxidase repeat-containing protein [TACK group archaeon]